MADSTGWHRPLVLLALALFPWTVFTSGGFVFAWGLVSAGPLHVTTLTDYLFVYTAGLPARLLAWPIAVALFALAVASAVLGTLGRDFEDRRVTGGLLVLAGASHLRFSLGLSGPGLFAVPVGTVLLWLAAWWFHWPDIRTAFSR